MPRLHSVGGPHLRILTWKSQGGWLEEGDDGVGPGLAMFVGIELVPF